MSRTATVPAGVATGVGSWPGTHPGEAAATIVGELPDLPHLVELPARGVGADLIGRASAFLVDLPVDTTVRGYRLATRPGRLARRAFDLLRTDLDALEEAWETAGLAGTGRVVKVQAAGPLTLAAHLELGDGYRALTDPGAVRDLTESLAEGLTRHIAEVAKRLGATVLLQLDEPELTAVLAGSLTGPSIWDPVPAMPEPEARAVLDTVIDAQTEPVLVHTCARRPAVELLRQCNAAGFSIDLTTIPQADFDQLAAALDAGKHLTVGLVPSTPPAEPVHWRDRAAAGTQLIDQLGFSRKILATQITVSPTCGLSGAPLSWARQALRLTRDIAHAYATDPTDLSAVA